MRLLLIAPLLLAGCAYNVTLMPRDSGKTFVGTGSRGQMNVSMGAVNCAGPVARTGSNEATGVASTFGANSNGTYGTRLSTVTVSGDVYGKAILSCTDGSGLRCDLTRSGSSGGGICVDDKGKVYDALLTRQ